MLPHFKSVLDFYKAFPTEESCIDFLEYYRWGNTSISPFDKTSKVWKCKGNKYKCKNTGKYFTVRTGTIFGSSKVTLQQWFVAIWLMTSGKKGISSLQLSRELNIPQPTAWFLLHRIRKCFHIDENEPMEGIFMMDESFFGGKNINRHKNKKFEGCQGRSFKDKFPVLGILQKGGLMRAFATQYTNTEDLQPHILRHIKQGSTIVTDEWTGYNGLADYYTHYILNHKKKQYVCKEDSSMSTNAVENFWSIMKKGYKGIYNWWKRKHVQRYVDEFVFRYNTRSEQIGERFLLFFSKIQNRITLKELISQP
jgi:transposase-like protein